MNGLNNFDKTDREYPLAPPTDDLIRCLRWKVKVTAGFKSVEWRYQRRCWGAEVYLL